MVDGRERRRRLQKRLEDIKLEAGCSDCQTCPLDSQGFPAPWDMHFDHLPGFVKIRAVSDMIRYYGWAKTEQEIAKCEVVCSGCHEIRTSKRLAERFSDEDS